MAPDFDTENVWLDPQAIKATGMPYKDMTSVGVDSYCVTVPIPSCPKSFAPHVKISPPGSRLSFLEFMYVYGVVLPVDKATECL